ncbi:conserved Plasmodium protein, unknown function [Plasmodium chabaudi adami]|uniref:Cell division control protein 73 C-terminal domain-containing protein n=1 Tax=Plasmodium chabaudi adami TaxID=5826 RepID=A0A1C6YIV1_PLACE|nr:conserved Plasmodium protein, unknown function [Plasmodium chabaudi adami]
MDTSTELKQLDLKVLMKKFLSDEKENIKLEKKDDKDIIIFEKNNFYIYSDVICGIENRKKEKYNVGDIYLFLCLPKSSYTFSYINSIGYKYISILERNKIIKKIEDQNNEDEEDQIKVNFYIYDKKNTINLNYYLHIEQEDIIQSNLFANTNLNDIICDIDSENENWGNIKKRKYADDETVQQITNTYQDDTNIFPTKKNKIKTDENGLNQEIYHNSTLNNPENKANPILYTKDTKNNDQPNESNIGLISFNNTNKICNVDKIYKSQIFYIKSGSHNATKEVCEKNKIKKKLNKNIKYNFIEEDIPSIRYDELFYFNSNEINLDENHINNISTNFKFLKRGAQICKQPQSDNANTISENDPSPNEQNEQGDNPILKHYYEHNIFKNIFFLNFNLYSLLNNTYVANSPKDDQIFSNLQILINKFFEEYVKYVKRNNTINMNDNKGDIIQFELNLNDIEPQTNSQIVDNINTFENKGNDYFTNLDPENQQRYVSINNLNYIRNTVLPPYLQNNIINYFKYSTSIETIEKFNDHDKLILFHSILNMYIYSLYDKNFYEQNKNYINFFHKFLSELSFEENFVKINGHEHDHFSEVETDSICSDKTLSDDLEKDDIALDSSVDPPQSKFYLLESGCIKINDKMDSKIFETLSENKYNKGNIELIKSAQIKEINYKDSYDIVGNNSCDFRRIYNLFKNELLDKSNIKNVYINGIKKNIIIDNEDENIKHKSHKKVLKIIDEIHLTYKRRPIILIESSSTNDNIINRNNIDSFFLHNNLDGPSKNEKQNNTTIPIKTNNYDGVSIIYNMFNKNIKFLFIENEKIDILSETDWKCVIAVIIKSKNSLKNILNKYPFEISTTLFQPFKTFAFMYTDETIPSDLLTGTNVDIIRLNRNNRKDDHVAAKKFWTNVEKFILQRRDKNFYKKKKL